MSQIVRKPFELGSKNIQIRLDYNRAELEFQITRLVKIYKLLENIEFEGISKKK